MKRAVLVLVVSGLVLAAAPRVLQGGVTVEISREAGGVSRTATEKKILLVLPERVFRTAGETAFTTPYIAELYYRTEQDDIWETAGLFKDLDEPFEFTADDEGCYEFFVTLYDRMGRHDVSPDADTEPHVTVLVDWTAPDVEVFSPEGGELIGADDVLEIEWSAEDLFLTEEPITIEYTADEGKTWQAVAEETENEGLFAWKPPADFDGHLVFRVTALDAVGHSASAVSAAPVMVDTAAPQAVLTGPRLASKPGVTLEVSACDGEGSGVSQLTLWVTHDGGVSWAPAGDAPAAGPVVFSSTTGKYGLSVAAVDRAGNTSPVPAAGDAPQIFLRIDTKVPLVRLDALNLGGAVKGGSRLPVQWEASAPAPSPRPVAIFLSPDGGNAWNLVADDLPNSGTYLWNVPAINSSNCYLKVVVRDSSGTIGEASSARPFTIDSMRPTSAIGLRPGDMDESLPDLAVVLRGPGAAAGEEPVKGEPDREKVRKEEDAPAPAEVPPYSPEPTLPITEPWTGVREEPYAAPPGPGARFEDVLKAAFAAYRAGRLKMAKDYLLRAAELSPNDPRPYAALGRTYARMARFNYTSKREAFEAAVYHFEKALAVAPDDADTLNDMGCVLLQAKRYENAEKVLRRATETGRKAIYWCNLGMALQLQGKDREALQALVAAAALEPDMKEANFLLGQVYSQNREWEKARDHWRKAADGYGADTRLGKVALSGLQQVREALGEISPEPDKITLQEKLDRVR